MKAALAITADGPLQHIKDLSADSMEGRALGTAGEQKTVAYMESQFKALGLKPGNPDGTYLQTVDLIGYKAHPTASYAVGGKTISLKYPDDFLAISRHDRPETSINNSDVVFVGYGVVAPDPPDFALSLEDATSHTNRHVSPNLECPFSASVIDTRRESFAFHHSEINRRMSASDAKPL